MKIIIWQVQKTYYFISNIYLLYIMLIKHLDKINRDKEIIIILLLKTWNHNNLDKIKKELTD